MAKKKQPAMALTPDRGRIVFSTLTSLRRELANDIRLARQNPKPTDEEQFEIEELETEQAHVDGMLDELRAYRATLKEE